MNTEVFSGSLVYFHHIFQGGFRPRWMTNHREMSNSSDDVTTFCVQRVSDMPPPEHLL